MNTTHLIYKKSWFGRRLLTAFIAFSVLSGVAWNILRPATVNAASTFIVNSINDTPDSNTSDGVCNDGSGNCTLRAAIEQANASAGPDTINFNIGSGTQTIVLTSDLPIIADPVVIDGTTQPGFAGTPIIEINGGNRSDTNRSGFFISAGSSTIRGLVINRFNNAAIALVTNDGNQISGNYIGTDVTGTQRLPNFVGIIVNTGMNTIGGTTSAARNVISGNNGAGLECNVGTAINNVIQGNFIGVNAAGTAALFNGVEGVRITGTGNIVGGTAAGAGNVISGNGGDGLQIGGQMTTVQGNFIGTNASGTAAIRNGDRGIRVFNSPNNVIGGTTAAARNVISGNFAAGISIEESGATGNVVQGNFIGTDVTGTIPLPNSPQGLGVPNTSGGISINRGSNNLIGGSAAGAANLIAFNGSDGVRVFTLPNTNIGIGNQISRNMIFSNLNLGIDLGANGVTANDAGDVDADANKLQNFPTITSVTVSGGNTTVHGTLSSAANTTYQLEFFANRACDASGNGEGALFLFSSTVATDANGNAAFDVVIPSPLGNGQAITATATDPQGNTSEFSGCDASDATGSIQFTSALIGVREDVGSATLQLERVGGTKGSVTVNFATSNDSATAGQDYTATSGTVTFADGEVSKSISVPITNDVAAEETETFLVTLSSPATPDIVGPNSVSVVRIFDRSTVPFLFVSGTSVTEGNAGIRNVVIPVILSFAIGQTVTVQFQTFEIAATSGVDFLPVSGSLTFTPGTVSQTVSVPIVGDVIDEPNENFRIILSNAVNAISFSVDTGSTDIVDDDAPPTISVNDVGVIEPGSATTNAVFTVTLSGKSSRQIVVNFATADGTATAGADYQSTSGTVTFNAGETSKTVSVTVNSDAISETLETFVLNLTQPVNATIADGQGTGTIGTSNSVGVGFSTPTHNATEADHAAQIVVTRSGDTSGSISVDYATSNGSASERSDYTAARGTLSFNAGEISKSFTVLLNEDAFQEGVETIILNLSNATGGSLIVGGNTAVLSVGDSTVSSTNPVDDAMFFVRQQYHDFLNREPDTSGFNFWVNEITSCAGNAQCVEVKRIHVSAAFFLSIEFQETGYLVYRIYKSAFDNLPGKPVPIVLNDFLRDTQEIGKNVQVNVGDWQAQLEANKQAFTLAFVQRADFLAAFPNSMTATEFVTQLNTRAGGVLSPAEQTNLINLLGATPSDVNKRSQVLRAVAEDDDLKIAEFNKAFVLMQYFGYLRRNPNDSPDTDFGGYNFWLTKLNQFNGNFIEAELVKAFIQSIEYRQRFGP